MHHRKVYGTWKEFTAGSKGFDWNCYKVTEKEKANYDFSDWINATILRLRKIDLPTEVELVRWVDEVAENHFQHFGEYPHSVNLYYLSNVCLLHYIKDVSRTKVFQENGFQTPRQIKGRFRKEFSTTTDKLDFYSNKKEHKIPKQRNTMNTKE